MAEYDFIVVGAGPAGCALAARLAESGDHQVLLLEAGGPNDDLSAQSHGERWMTFLTRPSYNWQYKSTPQQQLGGKILSCDAGKGLGGGTCINFANYTYGPSADFERWAEDVGDDAWRWNQVQKRFAKLENYHMPSAEHKVYADPGPEHGTNGPVDVSFEKQWERGFKEFFDTALLSDFPQNLDFNSGNPIGWALSAMTSYGGRRTTASNAYLSTKRANLTVRTDVLVHKVVFEGAKAVGVETAEGTYHASKEIVLSAGAIQSPKILLLSGIGPKAELAQHGIDTLIDNPNIGKNLVDHALVSITVQQKPGTNDRGDFFGNPDLLAPAQAQWLQDRTGPLSTFYASQVVGFLKLKDLESHSEFQSLPAEEQAFLVQETVPHFELLSHGGPHPDLLPTDTYFSFEMGLMNPQARGSVTLTDSDPTSLPQVDDALLRHPYDRRIAIEALRVALRILDLPDIKKDTIKILCPPLDAPDDELWEHIKKEVLCMWHMSGTVRMGKPDAPDTCVDSDFRVVGVEGLRVADMSVVRKIPNTHTSAIAYLIGETAAEKILTEYGGNACA